MPNITVLNDAKAAKRQRRARGEAVGGRGIARKLTRTELAYRDSADTTDELERDIEAIVRSLVSKCKQEAAELNLYLLQNKEPDPFAAIPF